jgi:hypothetical protein
MFDFAGGSQAAESFVNSFGALVEFVESTDFSMRRFGAFHLSGLPELGLQYGHDSDAYSGLMLAVKAALSNVRRWFMQSRALVSDGTCVSLPWSKPISRWYFPRPTNKTVVISLLQSQRRRHSPLRQATPRFSPAPPAMPAPTPAETGPPSAQGVGSVSL